MGKAVKKIHYLALALILTAGEGVAGSPTANGSSAATAKSGGSRNIAVACFVAAGGSATLYNFRCTGHAKISEVDAAEFYIDLPPMAQVAADVAAEEMTAGRTASVRR